MLRSHPRIIFIIPDAHHVSVLSSSFISIIALIEDNSDDLINQKLEAVYSLSPDFAGRREPFDLRGTFFLSLATLYYIINQIKLLYEHFVIIYTDNNFSDLKFTRLFSRALLKCVKPASYTGRMIQSFNLVFYFFFSCHVMYVSCEGYYLYLMIKFE